MQQYQDLIRRVIDHGAWKAQRAQHADGTRPRIRSIFGHQMRFDLSVGFPLVTTKSVSFKAVKGEVLWFLSGSTNEHEAQALGVRFWDKWGDKATGELGPIYGKQWRRWEASDGSKVDQIANLVRDIRTVIESPEASCGRRLIVSAWNPGDQVFPGEHPAPAACHTLFQCNVTGGRLSTHLYQRSADILLGVPYNIAGYALLTHMLAHVTGLGVGEFIHSFGDAHLYEDHIPGAEVVAGRTPRALPHLSLDASVRELDQFTSSHITIGGYDPHPNVGGEVAV